MPELLVEQATGSALSRANPFPGLRPYEEADANWFFGRGGEINELLKRMRRLHFVAIVGASGSGKSSLVRAGVLPQIRDGYLDAEWTIATFRPGDRPLANLAEAVCPAGVSVEEFTRALRSGSQGLVRGLGSCGGKILILVDQFEELFQFARRTGDAAQEEVKEFLKLLLAAANSNDVDVYVVITMRLEWLNECATYTGLAEAINEGIYLVPQMTRRQFQQAILGPLEAADGSITTALLGRMLNDLDNKTDQLPVLQHALMRIWKRTGASDAFDTKEYETVGTFSNCLSAHAEEVYAKLTDREKVVAELLFRNITQVYQNRKIRRPQPVREILAATRVGAAELAVVVLAFSKAGRSFLVTTEGALTPESIVDVSHEALIRQWVRLCGWVEDEADRQSRVSRLEVDAAEWARDRKRFKGSLYRGFRLQRAEELRPALDPASVALEFLNESSRERIRQRVIKRGAISLAVLAVVAFALGAAFVSHEHSKANLALAKLADAQKQQAQADANIASLEAKKAQEFQKQLVDRVTAAKGSATALAAIAQDIQAKRVYVQYVPSESQLMGTVQKQLTTHGYSVPGAEQVSVARAPGQPQVRFFHAEDRGDAGKIAALLKASVPGGVTLLAAANPNGVVPAGQFEVWLVSTAVGKVDQPAMPSGPVVPTVAPTPVAAPAPQISASVSQEKVTAGKSVVLSWLTTNANEVQIEGMGMQGPRGSVSVTPQQTTTYRLMAKGAGGTSASTTVEVEVAAAAAPAPVLAAPTPAPTPAPVATAVATASEPAGVKAALTRYREAYESESLDDVRKAWPSVSKNDQKNMATVFNTFNAIRLTVNCRDEDIHVEGASASATCRQTFTYTQKGKKLPEQASTNTFRLKKAGGSWVVDGVQ